MPSFNVGSRAVPRNKTKVDANERLVEDLAETPPDELSRLISPKESQLVAPEKRQSVAADETLHQSHSCENIVVPDASHSGEIK